MRRASVRSVRGFGSFLMPFGMMTAIMVMAIADVFAGGKIGFHGSLTLGAELFVFAQIIFRLGFGFVREPYRWPF